MENAAPPSISLRSAVFTIIGLAVLTAGAMIAIELVGGLDRFRQIVTEAGSWAPFAYILVKASTFVVAPLSGTPLKISAGALFGLWEGTVYTLLGDVLGGSANYWIARSFGRRVVQRLVGKVAIARIDQLSRQLGGWRALLFGRVVLSAIYDFISYAAGLVVLPFRQYLIITALGGIVPVIFWVTLGANFSEDNRLLLWVYGGIAVVFLVAVVLQSRIRRALHRHPLSRVLVSRASARRCQRQYATTAKTGARGRRSGRRD